MLKWMTVITLAASATAAMAEPAINCTAPTKPEMPKNGAALSAKELDAAADLVSAFSKDTKAYQGCLDQVLKAPGQYSRAQWHAALKSYNAAAPGVEAVWDAYQKLSDDWVSAHLIKTKTASRSKTASTSQ